MRYKLEHMFETAFALALDNRAAARAIFGVAGLLESLGANQVRVRAYRRAAISMLRLPAPAGEFLDERGELALPWLGDRLRRKLGELLRRGRMQFHDDLLDELPCSVRDLLSVPGVGPRTTARLIQELGIASVEDLARAARAGHLQSLRGIGPIREQRPGAAAEQLLSHSTRLTSQEQPTETPPDVSADSALQAAETRLVSVPNTHFDHAGAAA